MFPAGSLVTSLSQSGVISLADDTGEYRHHRRGQHEDSRGEPGLEPGEGEVGGGQEEGGEEPRQQEPPPGAGRTERAAPQDDQEEGGHQQLEAGPEDDDDPGGQGGGEGLGECTGRREMLSL